jgi:signal transduction histidine kinase
LKRRSLTITLITGVLLAELVCAVCFSVTAIVHQVNGRRHAFDVLLRGHADSLLGAIRDAEDPADNVVVDQTELVLPAGDLYEVTMLPGRDAGHSPNSSPELRAALVSHARDGYFSFKAAGAYYRGFQMRGMRVIDRDENGGYRRPVVILYASPTNHLWHEAMEAARFYVITSAVLILLTGLAIAWLLRRWLSPLRELAFRAERVSSDSWEFVAPAEVLNTRELEPIATSIQNLLAGLRRSFERQRQFTGDAAHELKTSVAVVKSGLQLLLMRKRTPTEYEGGIERLLLDVERIEDLTSRMLLMARLEQTNAKADAATDVAAVLRSVLQRLETAMQLKGIRIDLEDRDEIYVNLSPDDLDILCSNLLMNAAEHSSAGSVIRVVLRSVGEAARLLVMDEGEGIPEEALPLVFERFYRADPSRSRSNGGAGLGLAICKAIVSIGGGSVEIASVVGKGTTVTVALPLAAVARATTPAQADTSLISSR